MAQSENGRIRLFEDFFNEDPIAETVTPRPLGPFLVAGQGSEVADAGVISIAGVLSGAGRITSTDEAEHTTLVGTQAAFDVGLMGSIVLEVRVQFNNTATKETFIGFSDIAPETLSIETDVVTGASTTLTYKASDVIGFFQSADLSDAVAWHAVNAGGTAASVTASGTADLSADDGVSSADATAGEWQVLKLEIANNGTARWYVDGDLKRTLAGAVSTTTNLALCVGVESKGTNIEELDVDYIEVKANRDWTV